MYFLTSRFESDDITNQTVPITIETNNGEIVTCSRMKITKSNFTFVPRNCDVLEVLLVFTIQENHVTRDYCIRFFAVWNVLPRKYTTCSRNMRNVC